MQRFEFFVGEACPAGPVCMWLASLATTLGDYDAAERWLDVAQVLCGRLGASLLAQYGALMRARLVVLSRPHELSRARDMLRHAAAFAEIRGLAGLRASVQRCELYLHPGRPPSGPLEPMSHLRLLP